MHIILHFACKTRYDGEYKALQLAYFYEKLHHPMIYNEYIYYKYNDFKFGNEINNSFQKIILNKAQLIIVLFISLDLKKIQKSTKYLLEQF